MTTVSNASEEDGELSSREGNDTGPSVPVELPCEVCASLSSDKTMLLCDTCNKGTHMECLKPPLTAVPEGAWIRKECQPEPVVEQAQIIDLTATHTDITKTRQHCIISRMVHFPATQ